MSPHPTIPPRPLSPKRQAQAPEKGKKGPPRRRIQSLNQRNEHSGPSHPQTNAHPLALPLRLIPSRSSSLRDAWVRGPARGKERDRGTQTSICSRRGGSSSKGKGKGKGKERGTQTASMPVSVSSVSHPQRRRECAPAAEVVPTPRPSSSQAGPSGPESGSERPPPTHPKYRAIPPHPTQPTAQCVWCQINPALERACTSPPTSPSLTPRKPPRPDTIPLKTRTTLFLLRAESLRLHGAALRLWNAEIRARIEAPYTVCSFSVPEHVCPEGVLGEELDLPVGTPGGSVGGESDAESVGGLWGGGGRGVTV
ncbi:hypothetical protein P153DRAFT_398120 [Dothidotthia symphoricarpi CBS 119687]|uniref:Uncharacterized protein n=1 Tax=Dothidotthia symphoricarpi CBS 119687 TaxID=1392245 RepID=A0A6A6A7D7_9PLEO|nr:uncharacterized protein P153DRAFT_398120 [Dothidotthia symphoricarpi CBS 119687]KAF2127496.1 hypothetical protein P153DRAFT_398120 [Dothidotthia symphoricarpi CBS 119687]